MSAAGSGTFIANGVSIRGADPGLVAFFDNSSAGSATLISSDKVGRLGGVIEFGDASEGGTARVELFGQGNLSFSSHASPGLTIGSPEGDGFVSLDNLVLVVGSNGVSTEFSGLIEDILGGSLTKIGGGTLTLSGANTYTGGTTMSAGTLVVSNKSGSGTGTGPVQVNGGTLGGSGTISGAVTENSGATLAPPAGTRKQATLPVQSSVTFNAGSTYSYTFKGKGNKARTNKVVASGVAIANGAAFNFSGQTQGKLRPGFTLTVMSNTSASAINGTFSNLPDGAVLTLNGNNFQASYEGGDGNDLTLTVVP
jgi:fibronectin-binding autotransporter adhesin